MQQGLPDQGRSLQQGPSVTISPAASFAMLLGAKDGLEIRLGFIIRRRVGHTRFFREVTYDAFREKRLKHCVD